MHGAATGGARRLSEHHDVCVRVEEELGRQLEPHELAQVALLSRAVLREDWFHAARSAHEGFDSIISSALSAAAGRTGFADSVRAVVRVDDAPGPDRVVGPIAGRGARPRW